LPFGDENEELIMFNKILIPLDLTDKHRPALAAAVELAQKGGGQIYLLHVIERIPGLPEEEVADFYRRLEHNAEQHLARTSAYVTGKQIRCQRKVTLGSRAQAVADHAVEIEADLIVVSAPRFDPEQPAAGWASLSWKIGFLAPCPVLLVK
jgi:nucleotide-binding universal stress UspA family protein